MTISPVLQIVGINDDLVKGEYSITLSDGEFYILCSLPAWLPDAQLITSKQVTMHSIVRVKQYSSISEKRVKLNGESVTTCVVALTGIAVVKRNVSNIIGYPTTVRTTCTHSSSSSSSPGRPIVSPHLSVGSSSDSPSDLIFSQRLEIARGILAETGNSDIKSFAKQCCDALYLPRNLTEGFRSLYIMHYCAFMEQSLAKVVTGSHGRAVRAFETYLDCVEGCTQLFKSIASDMSESIDTRAMAVYACSLPSSILPYTASIHMNYLRRFIAMSKKVDLHYLPAPLEVAGCQPGEEMDIRIDPVQVFVSMLKVARGRLEQFGSLAASVIVGKPFADSDATFGLLLFGGARCDNCGKTPDDAGMNYLFKCKACRLAWYCSESCQAECWSKGHRDCCKKFGSFEEGDLLVLFGLKKRYDLNLSIVRLLESDVNGRLKVVLVASGTQGAEEAIGVFGGTKVVKKNIGHRATAYSAGTIISVKKENLRHCRPLQ